jgi:hypothetical protein
MRHLTRQPDARYVRVTRPARELIPNAYRSFAEFANRGDVVEALGIERDAAMRLPVVQINLVLRDDVIDYVKLRGTFGADVDKAINAEVTRMAQLIIDRVKRGGEPGVRINPLRVAPNFSELYQLLLQKWKDGQSGLCSLCGGKLVTGGTNGMLQPSGDRIDNGNGAYDEGNVQITHLACNWAKNQYGAEEFEDWIAVIRGVDPTARISGDE